DSKGDLRVQSRGNYLKTGGRGQFEKLWFWLSKREPRLKEILSPGLILFGEWCYAKHSIRYNHLSDWFYAFDIYSLHEKVFWSSSRRNVLAASLGIEVVPEIAQGHFTISQLTKFLERPSRFSEEAVEGIYL